MKAQVRDELRWQHAGVTWHRDDGFYRGTGRTLRTLWRALLLASEKPRQHVLVVVDTERLAEWTWYLLMDLTTRVGIIRHAGMRRILFPNESWIDIAALVPGTSRRYQGVVLDAILEDPP